MALSAASRRKAQAPVAGGGTVEALKTTAGLLAVAIGLISLTIIALVGIGFVKTDNPSVVAIATGSFGIIGTIVGAYFGMKVGADMTQKAIDGLIDEAAKATTFAAHLDPSRASEAIVDYHRLRDGHDDPEGRTSSMPAK